jgi:hypothetical protein
MVPRSIAPMGAGATVTTPHTDRTPSPAGSYHAGMPWHVEQNGCPDGEPWAVIKDDDGTIAGCHESEDAANRQVAALYANEETMTTARTVVRPTAETLAIFDEAKVKRGSDGKFDKKSGSGGARPRGPGGFRPKKGQLQEDDVPATSPNGAKIVDFADGEAKYSDGSVLTKDGWSNVPAKNKARGNRFAMATKKALIEADAPAESPSGAPLAEFKDGKAMYADGAVYDATGWVKKPAKGKQGWKFAVPTTR